MLTASMMSLATGIVLLAGCGAPSIDDSLATDDVKLPDRAPPSSSSSTTAPTDPAPVPPKTESFAVNVTLAGPGKGTITSTPSGVTCTGATCKGTFPKGTSVTLVSAPAPGSLFAGWSGLCTGSATCVAKVDKDLAVTAQLDSIVGTWTGTYTNTRQALGCTFKNAGNLSVTVTETGAMFTDTGSITGLELRQPSNGCALVGSTTGSAPSASVAVTTTGLTGTWNFDVQGAGGTLPFPFTGKVSGKSFTGTWTCATCMGGFTLTKP